MASVTLNHRLSLPLALIATAALALGGCEDKTTPAQGTASPPATAAKPGPTSAAAPEKAGGKVASCDAIKAEGLCREYGDANISAAGEEHIKKMCEGMGEFKLEPCPKDKRVGSCVTPEGTKVFYNEGPLPLTPEKAEKQCKEGVPAGEWKAGQ